MIGSGVNRQGLAACAVKEPVASFDGVVDGVWTGFLGHLVGAEADEGHVVAAIQLDGRGQHGRCFDGHSESRARLLDIVILFGDARVEERRDGDQASTGYLGIWSIAKIVHLVRIASTETQSEMALRGRWQSDNDSVW